MKIDQYGPLAMEHARKRHGHHQSSSPWLFRGEMSNTPESDGLWPELHRKRPVFWGVVGVVIHRDSRGEKG